MSTWKDSTSHRHHHAHWWGHRGSRPVLLVPTLPVRLVCRLPLLVMKCDNQLKYYFAKTTLQEILERLKNVFFNCLETSLVTEMVKNLPAKQETWVWSLGQEDSLKKGMATHSSVLAWKIPWTEESDRLQSMGSQRVRNDWSHIWLTGSVPYTPDFKTQYMYELP